MNAYIFESVSGNSVKSNRLCIFRANGNLFGRFLFPDTYRQNSVVNIARCKKYRNSLKQLRSGSNTGAGRIESTPYRREESPLINSAFAPISEALYRTC